MSQAMVVGVFVASCLGALFAECICGVVFVSGDISPAARCPRKLCLSGVARISGSIRLKEMNIITTIPEIDKTEFIQQFDFRVIQPVKQNPEMLYKKYWMKRYFGL